MFFFLSLMGGTERGQRRDSSCLPNMQPTGWRVENEIFRWEEVTCVWLQVCLFFLRNHVLYFTSSCHYKLNLPIKRVPTWRPPGFTADFLFLVAAPLTPITRWPSCFIPKKHHPTRITSCVPVRFPSSERCPTVYLSVCDIAMATNIRPRS